MGKLATDPIDNIKLLTLIKDPNEGEYSRGKWLAFHSYDGLPPHLENLGLLGTGMTTRHNWSSLAVIDTPIGKGDCPVLAAQDLGRKLEALYGQS